MSSAQKNLEIGLKHHRLGEFDQAEKIYKKLLKSTPNNADLYHLLGLIEYQKKNYNSAVDLIQKAIKINENSPTYYVNLGAALQCAGKLSNAKECYSKALDLSPGFLDAEINLALLIYKETDCDLALEKYKNLIEKSPNKPQIYFELANTLCLKGDYCDAIDNYKKTIELKPEFAQAHNYLGVALKGAGLLEEAVQSCNKSLELEPRNSEAFNNIGNIYQILNDYQKAIESYKEAIRLQPDFAEAHYNMANALYRKNGNYIESVQYYEKATELKPDYVDALNNLANAYKEKSDYRLAAECYRKALKILPEHPELHNNCGNLQQDLKNYEQAIKHYQQAIKLKPDYSAAYSNLGNALAGIGRYKDAIQCHSKAIEIKPDYAEAYSNLGNAFQYLNLVDEAEQSYKKALALNPNLAETLNNLGTVFKDRGKLSDAVDCYRKSLEIKKDYSYACSNLGVSLKSQGFIEEAIKVYKKTIELNPTLVAAHSNLLLALNYVENLSAEEVFQEHLNWAQLHTSKIQKFISYSQTFDTKRKLKIGYVSSDFKNHSVAFFVEAFLKNYNKTDFEVICYSGVASPDEVTLKLKSYVDIWRNCFGFDDNQLAKKIHEDQVDILVDLSSHTSDNRILVFAAKPAPLQITYIGYPNTSGMQEMDYRLVDSITDPKGYADNLNTEKLLRLPDCFLCYSPPESLPKIQELPAEQNGYITFASFNNLAKISPKVIDLWVKILKELPSSKLIVKNHSLTDGKTAERYYSIFEEKGIERERIKFYGWIKSKNEHFDLYNSIDIALDTFPYNGTTTTCEALLMGVPVVAIEGHVHASRVSASLLNNVGLKELIVNSEEKYFQKVIGLAQDIDKLSNYRKTIRQKMLESPLFRAEEFTQKLEKIYKDIWMDYCKEQTQ